MLKEAENDAPSNEPEPDSGIVTAPNRGMAGLRHVDAPQTRAAPSNPQLPPGQNVCADCERLIVGVFVRIKDKNLHVECFKCATCGSSLKNVGYYNINNKLYCDIHAKSAAIAINNPAAVPIVSAGVKAPVSAISSALAGHSLPSQSPLSPKTPNFAPSYPPSTFGGPKPFSSVSAPLSPGGGILNRGAPLSPPSNFNKAPLSPPIGHSKSSYSPASTEGRTTNIIWPPPQDSELATACPLFYPPPSKVEAELEKKLASKRKTQFESDYFAEDNMDETMSFYSEEMSFTGRRSAAEILSETLDNQKMIESALKATSVSSIVQDCCQNKEFCDLKRPTQYQPNTVECQLASKIENSVPQKWESSLTQAVRTTAPDPDTFCRIPSRTGPSPLAAALSIAPAQPFHAIPHFSTNPVPLPEETEPYFPPEHPVVPAKLEHQEKKEEKKKGPIPKPYSPFVKALEIAPERPFTPVGGSERAPLPPVKKKPKDPLDQLLDELPKANERLDMRSALTTAPERPYTPLVGEQVESPGKNQPQQHIKPLKPEELPASFRMNKQEPKPPSYYAPAVLEERIQSSTQESSTASETKIVEKEIIQPAQLTQQVVAQECQASGASFAPIFQGFTCSFKNKTDHSQFSVDVCTTPPVPTPPPKPQTPISYIATVEAKPACITRERIVQEKSDQTSKHIEQVSHVVQRQENIQRQAEEVIQVKPVQVATMLHKPQSLPGYQLDLKAAAEADLILMERKRRAEERIEQQKKTTKPTITVESSETNHAEPKTNFNAVLDDKGSSGSFSPRPRSITPSMINKAPPLLPYYQDNLVPHFQSALETNVFDPAHPEISRSPSPHPGKEAPRSRSPSPFPCLSRQERGKSPAEGPPPNPLHSSKPLPTPQDSRIRQAKESLQSYLPEYKSQRDVVEQQKGMDFSQRNGDCHVSQNVAYPADVEFGVRTGNVQQVQQLFQSQADGERYESSVCQREGLLAKTSVSERSHEEQLSASNKTRSQSTEVSADGLTQVQRRKIVTEEYERSHKENNLQIEKTVTSTSKYPFSKVNAPVLDPPNVQSFHVTNPHHVPKDSRLDTQATLHQASRRLSADSQVQPQLASNPPQPPVRRVFPPGSLAPIKHVAAPSACVPPSENVTKPIVPKPDVGAGVGRQAGGVTASPKRGRGLVNTGSLPGSRVPLCGHCHGQIRGPFITALGKIWCPQHFTCNTPSCKRPLQDLGFVEEQGQLYCEYCFEQYLAPPCSKCNGKIKGDCLKAIGKNFHPECFNCVYCGKLFGNNPFFLEDGNPYCDADWNELFTTKCFACGFPVEAGDRWVEALNNNYHSQCFNCTMCKKNLEGQSFFAKGGRPFCKNHAR